MSTITSTSFLPEHIDKFPSLFTEMLGRPVQSVEITSMSGAGGFSGEMTRVLITWADTQEPLTMVMKRTKPSGEESSRTLGLAREAKFYEWVASLDSSVYKDLVPTVYYSKGDMVSGDKVILLEDLSKYVQSGYLSGGGSPLNWGRDLPAEVASKGLAIVDGITEVVAEAACVLAAKYHGQHWLRKDLLAQSDWMKGSDWFNGSGKESWVAGQKYITDAWVVLKTSKALTWSPYIVSLIDASISKVSWPAFQERLKTSHFTLAHGDFHPANMLCWYDTSKTTLTADDIDMRLVDWEVVGVGSGAQDIGQYMISHMTPETRRGCEHRLLKVYYEKLMQSIPSESDATVSGRGEYTYDLCYREYVYGGVERWMFLLIILANMCPDEMQAYFLAQVEAFAMDHNVTPESIGMSRL